MHPTLLIGPADWDAARMPRRSSLARIAALWRGARAAVGAIVYGDRAHHAELAYLTHFTPKLEAALALIPRVGAPRLLVGGGVNMLQAAKPLTLIESLRPLRDAGETVAQWAREQSGGGRPRADRRRRSCRSRCAAERRPKPRERSPTGPRRPADADAPQERARARRDPRGLRDARRRRSTAMRDGAALRRKRDRHGAGRRARGAPRGAQDVRTLFSLDGGRTLRPFEVPVERAVDPLQVYVAVRQHGYWAEGFAAVTTRCRPRCVREAARGAASAVAMIGPASAAPTSARAIAEAIRPMQPHPVTAHVHGNAIGLALEEHPLIAAESEDSFEAGDVYSLRVGVTDERDAAIVSAMVAVHEKGCDVLWSSPRCAP